MTKIENRAQYDWALARVEQLLPLVDEDTPRKDANFIELELLSNLVADYEEIVYPIGKPSLINVIKLRMYEMGLTQKALAELLGISPSRVNDIVSGRSEPTFKIARDISQKLNIDPGVVLGVD
jgi:HTH-type transcriptional regulator/antitoxin HigA